MISREEAKLKKDFCKDDMCRGLMDIVNEHINNIYDDFESRTCENCKYVEYGDYMCCSLTDNAFSKGNRIFKAIVNDKISCTIYEAKEESK